MSYSLSGPRPGDSDYVAPVPEWATATQSVAEGAAAIIGVLRAPRQAPPPPPATIIQAPVQVMPPWVVPAAVGGVGLLLVLAIVIR